MWISCFIVSSLEYAHAHKFFMLLARSYIKNRSACSHFSARDVKVKFYRIYPPKPGYLISLLSTQVHKMFCTFFRQKCILRTCAWLACVSVLACLLAHMCARIASNFSTLLLSSIMVSLVLPLATFWSSQIAALAGRNQGHRDAEHPSCSSRPHWLLNWLCYELWGGTPSRSYQWVQKVRYFNLAAYLKDNSLFGRRRWWHNQVNFPWAPIKLGTFSLLIVGTWILYKWVFLQGEPRLQKLDVLLWGANGLVWPGP